MNKIENKKNETKKVNGKFKKPNMPNHMLAVLTGESYYDDMELNLYYDKAKNGFSKYGYLGLYKDKSIVAIGKITNIIEFNNINGNPNYKSVFLDVDNVTEKEKRKIQDAVERANKLKNWHLELESHYYYIVEKFIKTDFVKISDGALWGRKKFDLCKVLGLEKGESLPNIEEIAKKLQNKTWD